MMNKLNEQEFNPAGDLLRRKWEELKSKRGLGRKTREQAGARLEIERAYKEVYATFQRNVGRGVKPTASNLYKWLTQTYEPEYVNNAFKASGMKKPRIAPSKANTSNEDILSKAGEQSPQPVSKKEFANFNAALKGDNPEIGRAIHDWLNKMGIDIPEPGSKEAKEVYKGMKYLGVFKDTPLEESLNEAKNDQVLSDTKVREIIYYTVQQHIIHQNMEQANTDTTTKKTLRVDAKVLADELEGLGIDNSQVKSILQKSVRESRTSINHLDFDLLHKTLKQTGISESQATKRIYERMISEAGNALDWKWLNTGSYYLAKFTSGNKSYEIYSEAQPDYSTDNVNSMSFELSYSGEDKYELTGFNEQFKVFATVAEIGIDLINKEKPDMIIAEVDSETISGFESAIKRQGKALNKLGYDIYEGHTDMRDNVLFIIKKSVDIDELNDQSSGMVYIEAKV